MRIPETIPSKEATSPVEQFMKNEQRALEDVASRSARAFLEISRVARRVVGDER